MKIFLPFLILFIIFSETTLSQTIDKKKIKQAFNQFKASDSFSCATIGFVIKKPDKHKPIYSWNKNKALVPASLQKILTTFAALDTFGKNFRFETQIRYNGEIDKKGVLNGNLYIKGGGDPSLGSHRLNKGNNYYSVLKSWTKKLSNKGIKAINGNIIADQSIFKANAIPDNWVWTDIGNYYGAGAYGLNYYENFFRIYFDRSHKTGSQTEIVKMEPPIDSLKIINNVTVAKAGTGDQTYIYGSPYTNMRFAEGTLPAGSSSFSVKASTPDPPMFCAKKLKKQLVQNDILVSGNAQSIMDSTLIRDKTKKLFSHFSPPLKKLISITNVQSINLYAEAFLNMMGYKLKDTGSTKMGVEALKDYWAKKNLEPGNWFIGDGSGLSPNNGIPPSYFIKALEAIENSDLSSVFRNSLPITGGRGTLKYWIDEPELKGKIRAKTGSMERVMNLAGYIKGANNKKCFFCLMINNYKGDDDEVKEKIEDFFVDVISYF